MIPQTLFIIVFPDGTIKNGVGRSRNLSAATFYNTEKDAKEVCKLWPGFIAGRVKILPLQTSK